MDNKDISFLIYVIVCSIITIIIGAIWAIKTKDKDGFIDSCLVIVVGFTPMATLLITIGLCFGLMFLVGEGLSKLFEILKERK